MAKFFNKFPKVFYGQGDSNSVDIVTNLTARYAIEQSLKKNSATYFKHFISEGETPEILAHKFYGSSEAHWIILLMNDIIDPQFDWPMTYDVLGRFIQNKYAGPEYADTANTSVSGITWANSNFKEYYKVQRTTNISGEQKDVYITITEDAYNGFSRINAYNITLSDGSVITREIFRDAKTYYDYEMDENEKRRDILILKKEFISGLQIQLEEFLNV
jgi:hypothetical protein